MSVQRRTGPSNKNRKSILLLNPHIWLIALITLFLSFLYYANLSMIDNADLRWDWFWNIVVFEYNHGINGSLYIVPFIYASIVFGWRGSVVTWLASMLICLPRIQYLAYNNIILITNLFILLTPLLIVLILVLQRNWREEIKRAAAERENERQAYLGLVLKAQEDERRRIAREIHDDTTQRLWIVSNDIQRIITSKSGVNSADTLTELEKIKNMILQISDDAKRLSLALRPGILDNLGLIPAMRWLVDQVNKEGSIAAKISIEGLPRQLPNDVNTHLYRITQETLNNIRRHSGADQTNVALSFGENTVRLIIQDNGKGMSPEDFGKLSILNKFGLLGINERTKLIGGTLKIESSCGTGTTLSIELADPPAKAG
jgi:two-component system, NarL family, sensor histidine kinase DegS